MNPVQKVMTSFKKMDKWVKYLLVVCVVLIIFYMVWPYNNFMGLKLNTFEGFSDKDPSFVFFFSPDCGHCVNAKPEWEKFEKKYKNPKISIISIDCKLDKNKDYVSRHGINGYPTFKFLPNGLSSVDGSDDFNGDRTEDGFLKFLSSK